MSNVKRRPYRSPVREQQAAATRARIAAAAVAEFGEHGWAGATVSGIAARADLTPQAVHLAVGGKAALLVRAVETAVAGAGDDVLLAERPPLADVYAPGISRRRRVEAFAAAVAAIYTRAGLLFLVLQDAARTDTTAARLAQEGAQRRLADHRRLAELLCPSAQQAAVDRLADAIWVLAGPAVFVDLVHRREWPLADYTAFVSATVMDAAGRAARE